MQTNRPLNRIVSLALCLILILGITPVSVFAEDAPDRASLGTSYHTGDIAVINNIIKNNWPDDETRPELAPENGSFIPNNWPVIWSEYTSGQGRRVEQRYIADKGLTGELNVSDLTALTYLNCNSNQLTALDVSSCEALTTLWCLSNLELASLNLSGCSSLKELNVGYIGGGKGAKQHSLATLDLTGLTALESLSCHSNSLTSLNLSDLHSLKYLGCGSNQFTALDVSGLEALERLNCHDGQLTSLDTSNLSNLIYLDCSNHKLTSLDVSNNPKLEELYIYDNQLKSLDITNITHLKRLNVSGNYLPSKEAVIGFTGTWDGVNFVFDPQRDDTPPIPPYPGGPNGGGSSSSGGNSSSRSSSSSRGSSTPDSFKGSTTTQSANSPVDITTAAATTAAKDAAAKAKSAGESTATAHIKNPGTISLAALNAMAKEAGMPLKLQADSMTPDGKAVDVRITLDPAQSTKGLNLAASTTSTRTKSTVSHFQKWFGNDLMAVSFEQTDSFGQNVQIAVKPVAGLNTANLVFYSYNRTDNTYTRIANPAYSVDHNGYVHFTTTHGGDIVISDGVLSKA